MDSEPVEEIARLSREIERLARQLTAEPPTSHSGSPINVRRIIKARRLRAKHLGPDLFADPAWDILLDLYAARQEGQRISISSLSIAADVPPTTALRWIGALVERGFLIRYSVHGDGRRVFVELTDETVERLESYLLAIRHLTEDVI